MIKNVNNQGENVFFVVGAAKSGTSSLYRYLDSHPDIHMCPHKDIACYFCRDYGMPLTFQEYYNMLLPDRSDYKVAGDGCHAYMTDDKSAAWIYSVFPKSKIIIILRNPADKIFSQYHWLINHGYEFIPTFEQALAAEEDRYARNIYKVHGLLQGYKPNYLYFRSALYAQQIEQYLEYFPRERILFLKFDDLKNNPKTFIESVYQFLGVDVNWMPDLKIYNERKSVRSIAFQYFCMKHLTKILPGSIVKLLMSINTCKDSSEKMKTKTKKMLLQLYRDDIKKTERLTNLSLQEWLR